MPLGAECSLYVTGVQVVLHVAGLKRRVRRTHASLLVWDPRSKAETRELNIQSSPLAKFSKVQNVLLQLRALNFDRI